MALRPRLLQIATAAMLLFCSGGDGTNALAHEVGDPAHPVPTPTPLAPPTAPLFRDDLELADTLGVGRVAGSVAEHLPRVEAMAHYLASQLTNEGIARGRPVIARDGAEMLGMLRTGVVDVLSESPITAMLFVEQGGVEILARERAGGAADYNSVFLRHKNAPLDSLEDLRGKRLVFEESGPSAFLLPLATLRTANVHSARLADSHARPAADTAGYFFAQSEYPITAMVRRGVAAAGALSGEHWRKLQQGDRALAVELEVMAETERLPRSFFLVAKSMPAARKEKLRDVLLGMHDDEAGRAILRIYAEVTRYDPIDDKLREDIERARQFYLLVRDEAL